MMVPVSEAVAKKSPFLDKAIASIAESWALKTLLLFWGE